jgi:hypothetical protein
MFYKNNLFVQFFRILTKRRPFHYFEPTFLRTILTPCTLMSCIIFVKDFDDVSNVIAPCLLDYNLACDGRFLHNLQNVFNLNKQIEVQMDFLCTTQTIKLTP